MAVLAETLDHFDDNDDEEVLRLFEQAKAIHTRMFGSSSSNVATCAGKLIVVYNKIAERAHAANNLDRELANLELVVSQGRRCCTNGRSNRGGNASGCNRKSGGSIDDRLRSVRSFCSLEIV